jgi:cytochrome P450
VGRRVSQRIKAALRSKEKHDDLAADLIRLHQEKPDFTDSYLRKMIVTNFGAGHETLASTLTSLVAMTGSHEQVHERVAVEARREAGPLSYNRADGMPYISAAIKESKRLHPVLSMSLSRRTPSPGVNLHGFFIPPGTTVGCNPIALHRNEDVCGHDPDAFDPGRWLRGEHWAREMELFSLAWGGGARTCPGRHLAELIVWKVYTAIVSEFDVVATLPEDSSQPSYFLSIMTGVQARFISVRRDPADPKG